MSITSSWGFDCRYIPSAAGGPWRLVCNSTNNMRVAMGIGNFNLLRVELERGGRLV